MNKLKSLTDHNQLKIFLIFTDILFFITSFILAKPADIFTGMKSIICSRDILITDYFLVGGVGAAFFNSALVMLLALVILFCLKVNFSGITLASVLIMGGFALFGKNPVNIFPIILGTFLYSYWQKSKPSRFIYTAFLATGVAPIISELYYILPFDKLENAFWAFFTGVMIGLIVPVLASHTATMHMGYNLFNVGFAVGIIALVIVSVMRSLGFTSQTMLIWQTGVPLWLCAFLLAYFSLTSLYGLFLCGWKIKPAKDILKHPGRSVADFVLMDGAGPTFVNMGIVGIMCTAYILLVGGDLCGPVVGAILTIFGFAAFGVHPKNYFPVLMGVFLSTTVKIFSPSTLSIQLAALFCAALAPIAGQYGFAAGVAAGFLHASVVSNIGGVYTGLNLYNNGFAAGFVAIIMLPLIESLLKTMKSK